MAVSKNADLSRGPDSEKVCNCPNIPAADSKGEIGSAQLPFRRHVHRSLSLPANDRQLEALIARNGHEQPMQIIDRRDEPARKRNDRSSARMPANSATLRAATSRTSTPGIGQQIELAHNRSRQPRHIGHDAQLPPPHAAVRQNFLKHPLSGFRRNRKPQPLGHRDNCRVDANHQPARIHEAARPNYPD